jgi:dihydrodipicolinate synthase/N-acetylneuraminate lyase
LLTTTPDGRLDERRLSDELDVLILSHPCGIYSNGTAGEFYTQDIDEFVLINTLLSEKCEKAGVAYQTGVSHPCAHESLSRLIVARTLKPGAVQVILPDWFPPGDEEIVAFMSEMEAQADGIPLVLYNPPHAKRRLSPSGWMMIKEQVPSLVGVKVFDNGGDSNWYEDVRTNVRGLAVFIPGHRLATGVSSGCHGAYSNVGCLNPFAAQSWWETMERDMEAALELESRIGTFMDECITPFITRMGYANHACDRFMALVGGWADVGSGMRWPYRSIPEKYVEGVRRRLNDIIPEFSLK